MSSLPFLPAPCKQLLNHPLTEARLRSFHHLMSMATMGLWPHTDLPGSRQRQCAAGLNFLLLFLGWVLPIWMVACKHYQAARSVPRRRRARLPRSAAASVWLVESVFLQPNWLHQRVQIWCFFAICCWCLAAATSSIVDHPSQLALHALVNKLLPYPFSSS